MKSVLKYAMEIDESPSGFAVPEIDAFGLALRLTSAATETSPDHNVAWAKILKSVEIEGESRVVFTLRTPFVRPEALLKLKYSEGDQDGEIERNGFYVQTGENNGASVFELNEAYPRHSGHQHPVIVEQVFENSSDAVDQLLAGNIDVLDRVPNADLAKIRENETSAIASLYSSDGPYVDPEDPLRSGERSKFQEWVIPCD